MYTLKLKGNQLDKLGQALSSRGWPSREVQWRPPCLMGIRLRSLLRERETGRSGQGNEDFVTNILEPEVTGEFLLGYEEVNNLKCRASCRARRKRKG